MIGKKITFGAETHLKMLQGIQKYEDAVVSTLGPKGNRVIIDDGTGSPIVTKDGVTVAKAISLKDKTANAAVSILKESALKTNKEAGDGTTTSTLLSCELVKDGFKLLDKGFSSNSIIKGIEIARDQILAEIDSKAVPIKDEGDIKKVALVSSNNDEEIASNVVEAFSSIGDNGVVTIQDSFNDKTSVVTTTGIEIQKGFTSSIFVNNDNEKCFESSNPKVYISYKPITDINQIASVLEYAVKSEIELIIIAPRFGENVLPIITQNVAQGRLRACLVNTPGFNAQLWEESTEDIAVALGTKGINKKEVKAPDTTSEIESFLGTCESIKVYANKTVFIGTSESDEFEKYINSLSEKLKSLDDDLTIGHTQYEKDKLKERIARLSGGVSTIYVGGVTDIELIEKKHRYEDAANAVRVALVKGVLPGGGLALYKAALKILKSGWVSEDKEIEAGWRLMLSNCFKPFVKILENMGYSQEVIIDFRYHLTEITNNEATVNQYFLGPEMTREELGFADYAKIGILDPLVVVEQSIKNSVSVASSLVSSGCIITDDLGDNISLEPNDPDVMSALKL